jgi:hypothetical protein
MSYTYIEQRQKRNGFVFTIDGYLTYSPMTSVSSGTIPLEGIASWGVTNQSYFYDSSRGVTIDRTGSFIKIYNADTKAPLALAVILKANSGTLEDEIRFKIIRYEFEVTELDVDPTFYNLELRLEDNWKFCSTVPDWIPANAESRNRWIPILSKDTDPSISQKLDLKGGFGSVDGISIPLVLDTRYQSNNRIQRMFAEDAVTYKYTNVEVGESDVDCITEEYLTTSETTIEVLDRGNPVSSLPDSAADYLTYYPFLASSGTELALPEPWFIDTEAVIAESSEELGANTDGVLYRFTVTRGIDSTPKQGHSQYTVIFRGMPFPIGQSCKLWEVDNFLSDGGGSWLLSYRGIVENIPLTEGLIGASIELSSLTFTARVNSGVSSQSSTIERRKRVLRSSARKDFYNSFIISQSNIQDTFQWVKIGAVALPLIRIENLNYTEALQDRDAATQLLVVWGLTQQEIESKINSNFYQGVSDIGYKVGFIDRYGDTRRVDQLYNARNSVSYGPSNEFSADMKNWFTIREEVYSDLLPLNSLWGFYILEPLADATEHDNFHRLRTDRNLRDNSNFGNDLSASEQKLISNYLSEKDPVLIHLFSRFCLGYSVQELTGSARSLWYTGGDSLITSSDFPNYSIEVSIIDVILQVLTSTGSGRAEVFAEQLRTVAGTNGAWDLIPRELGLGIPLEDIDLSSFLKVAQSRGGMNSLTVTNIYMELGKDDPQKFLDEQILKPFFLSIATDSYGKIILVDIADVTFGPETVAISPDQFTRKNGQRTPVTLVYQAEDLVDSFNYKWKEPSRQSWDDPYFNRSITSSGVGVSVTQRSGSLFQIKSKARVFPRIQSSPIDYELNYAPAKNIRYGGRLFYEERVGGTALFYLSRFNRIVPRATFELYWDSNSPDIGDTVNFNLSAIPNKDGLIGDMNKTIIGKIIDIKVDRKNKTAQYTSILTDSSLANPELVWNITAELIERIETAPDIYKWKVSENLFCSGSNPLSDDGIQIFQFDYSQFLAGSKVIIWDRNWRYVTDAEILGFEILGGFPILEFDTSTDFQEGYRITLATPEDTQSIYIQYLTWFLEDQKYL